MVGAPKKKKKLKPIYFLNYLRYFRRNRVHHNASTRRKAKEIRSDKNHRRRPISRCPGADSSRGGNNMLTKSLLLRCYHVDFGRPHTQCRHRVSNVECICGETAGREREWKKGQRSFRRIITGRGAFSISDLRCVCTCLVSLLLPSWSSF